MIEYPRDGSRLRGDRDWPLGSGRRWPGTASGRESTAVPGVEEAPTPVVSRRYGTWKGCYLLALDYEVRLLAVAGTVTGMPGVIAVANPVRLGTAGAPLRFAEKDHPGGWRGSRHLMLDDREAFELTFWCGTCPFLFARQQGANRVLSPERLTARLNGGLSEVDAEVVAAASDLLPDGEYLPGPAGISRAPLITVARSSPPGGPPACSSSLSRWCRPAGTTRPGPPIPGTDSQRTGSGSAHFLNPSQRCSTG